MSKKNSDARARFAQRLRAIRIPRGFKTARSFAEALEIDENRYTRYERAEVEPDLQLLMRICNLLGATPNDLLCDVIGAPPVDMPMQYGFAERTATSYNTDQPPGGGNVGGTRASAPNPGSLAMTRKATGFQLAELIATIEGNSADGAGNELQPLERLRLSGPIAARIEADAFQFLADLPDRLQGIDVSPERQVKLERLVQELIIAHKSAANDNN